MLTIFARIKLDFVSKQLHLIHKTFVGIACDGNMRNTVDLDLDLDLVPPVPDGTLGDEISPPVSIVGNSPYWQESCQYCGNVTKILKDTAKRTRSSADADNRLARLAVSRGQQTWYHSTCYIWFPIVQ